MTNHYDNRKKSLMHADNVTVSARCHTILYFYPTPVQGVSPNCYNK